MTSVAIILIMAALAWFSLWHTSREANHVDLERTRQAVSNAVLEEQKRLAALAIDNAEWDDAAIAVYHKPMDHVFIRETWLGSTLDAALFDQLMVTDEKGEIFAAFDRGKISNRDYGQEWGKGFSSLLDKAAQGSRTATGTVYSDDGLHFVAALKIRPYEPKNAHVGKGMQPILLVLSRRFDGGVKRQLGEKLVLKGLRFSKSKTEHSVAISDPAGKVLGWIAWDANLPGNQAIVRSLPWMVGGIMLCLLVVGFLARFGFRAVSEMNRSALFDALSHLPNRRSLRARLDEAIHEGETVALAFFDLDGFKAVNDNFGHAVGDELIQQCAALATDVSGQCQLVARLGGDEFAILATGQSAQANVEIAAEQLLRRITEPFRIGDRAISVGASIGLTLGSGSGPTTAGLMREADIAMYASKRAGKMRKTWFCEELDQMSAKTQAIEHKLREVLKQQKLEVHYQPIVDAGSGQTVAVEALLRWTDADEGEISPSVFIPVAEETGLINAIGLFVFRRACEDALHWPATNLSVNVSAAQLRNLDFPTELQAVLKATEFPAERLEIEITETYVAHDPVAAGLMFDRIRALGVQIALGDFGAGFTSIGFLQRFRFDKLKLDRSLVANATHDGPTRAILLACMSVAHSLAIPVTAEGIENAALADFMRTAGSDRLQGWHFGYAASADIIHDQVTGGSAKAQYMHG